MAPRLALAAVVLLVNVGACSSPEKTPKRDDESEEEEPKPKKMPRPSAERPIHVLTTTAAPVPVPLTPPPPPALATFKIGKTEFKKGESIAVTFNQALSPPQGQWYWITLVKPDAPEHELGKWHYIPIGATTDTLQAGDAGDFEIRLHDLSPMHKFGKVLARQRIQVTKSAATPREPFVPSTGFCTSDAGCPAGYYCGTQGNCFPSDPPKAKGCKCGEKYWGPCGRTGCEPGYSCAEDGHCVCKC